MVLCAALTPLVLLLRLAVWAFGTTPIVSPVSAGHCNTGLVGCLLMVRELEGVDAGSTSVVRGA